MKTLKLVNELIKPLFKSYQFIIYLKYFIIILNYDPTCWIFILGIGYKDKVLGFWFLFFSIGLKFE